MSSTQGPFLYDDDPAPLHTGVPQRSGKWLVLILGGTLLAAVLIVFLGVVIRGTGSEQATEVTGVYGAADDRYVPDWARTASADALAARFGAPADYAAELRTAAGLPLAPEAGAPDLGPTRWEEIVAGWGEQKEAATAHPAWPSVSSFALAVRPAWWVARGWVLFGILFSLNSTEGTVVAPGGLLEWIVFLGLVWLSVEYGRGRRTRR